MEYRRIYIKGGTYFFTLVTYHRRAIFSSKNSIDMLNEAFEYTSARMPFEIVGSVILPDHLHFIWTLPLDSSDFSTRWRLIKSHFTRHWCEGKSLSVSASRINKGEQDIWQRRFWEHLIRDEHDLSHHIEYIHYNPVKHGYVDSPIEWKFSSFMKYVQEGFYPATWGEDGNVWTDDRCLE